MMRFLPQFALLALGLGFAAFGPAFIASGTLRLLTEVFLVLTMAQLWNLLGGYTGLLSMGHQMFIGVGAYAVFYASNQLQISAITLLPLAAVAGGLLALLTTPLLFRLREAYFAVGSWVIAEVVYLLISSTDAVGASGGYPLLTLGLMNVAGVADLAFRLSVLLALAATLGIFVLMRRRFGFGLLCVRDNELAAQSIGVNITRNRRIVFVASGAGVALCGAILFLMNFYVDPGAAFDPTWTVAFLFIVIIGGIGTIEGPIVGTVIYFGLRELFSTTLELSGTWYLIALGVLAIAVMLVMPKGVWGFVSERYKVKLFDIRRLAPVKD